MSTSQVSFARGFFGIQAVPSSSGGGGGLFVGLYTTFAPVAGGNDNVVPVGPGWPGTTAAPYGRLDLTGNPGADFNLTGLLAGLDGQLIIVRNATAFNATLNSENAASLAANRFTNSFDVGILAGASQEIVYYGASTGINRWVVVS